ncbi:MAG TPA: ParB/RepB/Spo0J family partition protein [Planctomycetota bacterium]|nr:ParB/RepB/Spo0J family partition protein [Planctomycetota bacterium]
MGKRKLGRGLNVLLGRQAGEATRAEEVLQVPVKEIVPNPWQPRTSVSDEGMKGLVESIRARGVLQPIVLRRHADEGYEVVAGERRWRAAREAGLREIPAVLRDVPDNEMLLLALLENIQREDLNAIERAHAYAALMKSVSWTQEQLARHLSVARTTVANTVRLLELPEEIQDLVSRGTITAGHARALLAVPDPEAQKLLCRRIIREKLSVRQLEDLVGARDDTRTARRAEKRKPPHIRELEERLARLLGAKVTIRERKKGGKMTIDFASHDDFERILALLEPPGPPETSQEGFHV